LKAVSESLRLPKRTRHWLMPCCITGSGQRPNVSFTEPLSSIRATRQRIVFFAEYLLAVERIDKAIDEIKKAEEIDPISPIINTVVAWSFFFAGQYDEAIIQCHKALEIDSSFSYAH
jgi:tetratricopeptide (TPR) repeat protein